MDLDVFCIMYWCPYLDLEVPNLYSLVLPSFGRIEVVIPTIVLGLLVLAPSFIISTHPLPSSLVFNPTGFLTYGMEDLSLLEPLVEKPPCLYCVLALSWWKNLPSVSWIVCLNHSGRLSRCLALCRTPPSHLRWCWLKLKAHVLLVLEMFIYAPMENVNSKMSFLTYTSEGQE